jgi:hypothetical protein
LHNTVYDKIPIFCGISQSVDYKGLFIATLNIEYMGDAGGNINKLNPIDNPSDKNKNPSDKNKNPGDKNKLKPTISFYNIDSLKKINLDLKKPPAPESEPDVKEDFIPFVDYKVNECGDKKIIWNKKSLMIIIILSVLLVVCLFIMFYMGIVLLKKYKFIDI